MPSAASNHGVAKQRRKNLVSNEVMQRGKDFSSSELNQRCKLKQEQKISREKDINELYIGIRLNFLSPIRHSERSEESRNV